MAFGTINRKTADMTIPKDLLEESIHKYPGHCADYYAGMCRLDIPYVRKVIKAWIASGKLKVATDFDRSILDEAVEPA
jgi:hypothetical protein